MVDASPAPEEMAIVDPAPAVETEWKEDFSEAVRLARRERRPILLHFTGSDWSPTCSRWRQQILETPEFASYAAANLVLIEVDYPKHKEQVPEVVQQNQVLQAVFAVEGFPTLILLEPSGDEIERISGVLPAGPRDFIAWLRRGISRAG